jgi:hypothetical protein
MKNIFLIMMLLCIGTDDVSAQIDIVGLRVYANDDEYQPPIITMDGRITIEFDVTASLAPNLQIIFQHASKDWTVDKNYFVNDPAKIRADALAYAPAPNGVYRYTYRYKNSFPNARNNVAFTYSGNYIFTIVDRDHDDVVLAEGKFIVVEEKVQTWFTVENTYDPGANDPYNQVNFIAVTVNAPPEYRADDIAGIYHPDINTVRIIQNWSLVRPFSIDLDNRTGDTFVEDFTKPTKIFWIRNVPAGNEYRKLDLSSSATYPNQRMAIPAGGPDVSRFQWQGKPDANGASKLRPFTGANSDYLEVEMRLRLPDPLRQNVYIVGGFNRWEVRKQYRMEIDSVSGLYVFRHWLRRGVYDYHYVLGEEDAGGNVVRQDWIALEGNDWRTTNRYTVLVYYADRRFGGFDRIVGMMKGRSPGGTVNEKEIFGAPATDGSVIIHKRK